MGVLVTPGNLRSTLAVTRSLGRRGIRVTVADERRRSLAGMSRYCKEFIRVPPPAGDPEGFVKAVRQEVSRGAYRVIIPTDDVTLALLAGAKPQFEGVVALPFPDLDTVYAAHDKAVLNSLAKQKEIPVPKTVIVYVPDDVRQAAHEVGFPAVVKPRFSRFRCGGEWAHGGGTHYVHNTEELESACRAIHQLVPFPLVQEYIPGEGHGIFLLMNHGKVRAAFAHRRVREKPPSGGVSVLSESVRLDPGLLDYSRRLLSDLKWHGVAMVEFKRDDRDGIAKLIEINGRFWGSLQLAIDAGVDFPTLLYQLAVDGDITPVFSYKERVRLRWWLGDLDWLVLCLRKCRGMSSRVEVIWEFLKPSRARAEVFRWEDPVPQLAELYEYVGHIAR